MMTEPAMTELPDRARVVIIGGGVIGTSVAYHLAQLGWTDVLLLEQGRLSCGTTWHAAGLVGQLRASENGTRLVQYSCELYERLEAETGRSAGFRRCGGVTVARTKDRMTQLKRTAATAEAYQLECELISPRQAKDRYPILRDDDLEGAIWLPGDGRANPSDLTAALARGARDRGVIIREKTRVTGILTNHREVRGVRTDQGDVEAEVVVNCAGQWAKAVGALCGVTVPLHSAEHFYVVTEQIDGVHRDFPILRDPDGYTYIKEEVGGLVVGGFEPDAKPWVAPDALPYPFEFKLLEEDWDHFAILMDSAVHRIPVLAETGIKMFYNGPESFTPDNQFILGEAPELRNFFVGAGFNSVGIASAGGAGQALAEWITEGEPALDLSAVDIRRFAAFNGNHQWLHDRVAEVLGLHYAIPWPNRELTSARPFRRSPAYHLLKQANAGFGSKMGWERANFFAPPGASPDIEYGWGRQNWQPWSSAEQRAARTGVALFDQTSFSKYLLTGPDAERALQWLCTADVAVPPGRTVYTGMLNAHGTYEADITVTRLSAEEFLLVSSAASTERDQDHITRRMPAGAHASLLDVTSQYAVYGVMGPRSRDLLGRLSRADLGDEAFPFGSSRLIDLGYATVRATRITYVGELGWELYVPAEFAVGAYQDLTAAGAGPGLVNAGYYAIESLRLEKAYRAFGRELTPDYNPVEAGLLFACKLKTGIGFLGREAVEQARAAGPRRRMVSLVLADPEAMIWGGELVLRDGVAVGQVTSGAWGETLGACVALAYVRHPDGEVLTPDLVRAGEYQVNVGGRLYPAAVSLRPPFDPASDRVRGRYLSRTDPVPAPAPAASSRTPGPDSCASPARLPVSSSKIAEIGPSTSNPSPTDQEQSEATSRNPLSVRPARHGYRLGQTRSAAVAAARAGIGRGRPSGIAMSCPCTSTSMSGSRWLTPGAFRRDPAIARSRGAYSRTGSRLACRTALSWIIRSKFPLARTAATAAGTRPVCARVRCAATSRTRHPAHSERVSHSCSPRLSNRSARLIRSPSMTRHTSSRLIHGPASSRLIHGPASSGSSLALHRRGAPAPPLAWYDYLTISIMVRKSV
jgi:glycine cleavage system aminomethyltransferase T/glycine/D-amino acid oxidase-like deaminating enzyme